MELPLNSSFQTNVQRELALELELEERLLELEILLELELKLLDTLELAGLEWLEDESPPEPPQPARFKSASVKPMPIVF